MKESLLRNRMVRNLLLGVCFVAGIILAANIFLHIRTQHNREITVPDFRNLSLPLARSTASSAGVQVYVMDSIYRQRMPKGVVLNQLPEAGAQVKRGRKVALTITAVTPRKVKMPNLVGTSIRAARSELSAKGLVLGRLTYVSDIATNQVLRQTCCGRDIRPGSEVADGSRIDLTLGLNSTESLTYIPNLVGCKYLSAVDMLHENSLNLSAARFGGDVRSYADTLAAVVTSQQPASGQQVLMGTGVTLWLENGSMHTAP
ncbi:MAG: PASTA domain-containing protein [Bacteroidales bacterium]|nr:PASTA domain-containing protein [Bacteroidales bacterium]